MTTIERFRERVNAYGLRKLARTCDLSPSFVLLVVEGKSRPSPENAKKMMDALQMTYAARAVMVTCWSKHLKLELAKWERSCLTTP